MSVLFDVPAVSRAFHGGGGIRIQCLPPIISPAPRDVRGFQRGPQLHVPACSWLRGMGDPLDLAAQGQVG